MYCNGQIFYESDVTSKANPKQSWSKFENLFLLQNIWPKKIVICDFD